MNYLAHLHLGGEAPEQLLGSLYGDFVKGPLTGRFAPEIEAAILLHRRIDAYTDAHHVVRHAVARFSPQRRRYAPILLDVFFDHCLARDWAHYSEVPLAQFTAKVYHVLASQVALPGRLASIAPRMAEQDWLSRYQQTDIIEPVVHSVAKRLSKPLELLAGLDELQALYRPLSEDFAQFYPELIDKAVQLQSVA